MNSMSCFFSWGWLLGVALIAPVALPAGGAVEPTKPEIRREKKSRLFFAGTNCALFSSPSHEAPALRKLELGTPLRLIQCWQSAEGRTWLRVKIDSQEMEGLNSSVRRGWINVH